MYALGFFALVSSFPSFPSSPSIPSIPCRMTAFPIEKPRRLLPENQTP